MRISDWSSDVCSSDLKAVNARDRHLLLIQACNDQPGKIAALADKDHDVAGAKRAPLALEHQAAVQPFADMRRQPGSMLANGTRQPILRPRLLAVLIGKRGGRNGIPEDDFAGMKAVAEIGRAQCRERVCQYV